MALQMYASQHHMINISSKGKENNGCKVPIFCRLEEPGNSLSYFDTVADEISKKFPNISKDDMYVERIIAPSAKQRFCTFIKIFISHRSFIYYRDVEKSIDML